jgi:hypothetical protein
MRDFTMGAGKADGRRIAKRIMAGNAGRPTSRKRRRERRKHTLFDPTFFVSDVARTIEKEAGKGYKHAAGPEKAWMHPKAKSRFEKKIREALFGNVGFETLRLAMLVEGENAAGLVRAIQEKEGITKKQAKSKAEKLLHRIIDRSHSLQHLYYEIKEMKVKEQKRAVALDVIAHFSGMGRFTTITLRKLEQV